MAGIGRATSIAVNPGIDITACEVDAHKRPWLVRRGQAMFARQVQMLASQGGRLQELTL
jgi:hypothetical protein